jgi:hypothetical protein
MFGTELSCEFMRDLGLVVFGVGGALKDARQGVPQATQRLAAGQGQ